MQISSAFVSVATPDLPRLQRFYRALLGIPPQVQLPTDGDPVYVEFRLPGLRLGLYRNRHLDCGAQTEAVSLCLQVQDLQGSLTTLEGLAEAYQLSISPLRQAFHGQEVDFRDPDGNRIVLHQPSAAFGEAIGWDPQG
ncbi:MAG TPA: VOC family protein [Synechococcus sp. M44_DOE_062]|nr:VOC family protein [Synechococcus sp. M44_DOE_062]